MIEIKGANVYRYGERIGMVQGSTVFLMKELSGQDKRKIQESIGEAVGFSRIGSFVGAKRRRADRSRS